MTPLAVGFDFDHTLGVDNKLERTVALEKVESVAKIRGLSFDESAAALEFDKAFARVRAGEIPLETALAGLFFQLVGDGPENELEIGRYRDDATARAPEFVKPLPGLTEMLAGLDALGVRYAILSNGWSPLQEEKARIVGFAAPVFVSERIGVWKPDPAAFLHLTRAFELPADMIWYVGDDPRTDCAGAAAAGLRAVWCDWEGAGYPSDIAQPDGTIRSLEELAPLLQGRLGGAANPGA